MTSKYRLTPSLRADIKMATHTPLSLASASTEIVTPFEPDFLLDRKELAQRLTSYIDRLKAGAVIGISAPWGEGKSWFGRNWAEMLRREEHKIAFIDAFENDYLEDPFILIASELGELLEENPEEATSFRKTAAGVAKALVPLGTKALVNLIGRTLLGSANLSDDFNKAAEDATEGAANITEKWLEERLASVHKERASVKSFRQELQKAASTSEKPVVIFIDELDRCKPTFAVTLIERLKHLFDVPNLIFVLLVNRPQLERAIEGQYGQGTDGSGYLSKFVNLWFDLSKGFRTEEHLNNRFENFVSNTLSKYKIDPDSHNISSTRDELILWASKYNFSLRDIERACTLIALLNDRYNFLSTYLIAQKVKNGVRFSKLRVFDQQSHLDCATELNNFIRQAPEADKENYPFNLISTTMEYHKALAKDIPFEQCHALQTHGKQLFGIRKSNMEKVFTNAANAIDLPITQR